MALPGGAVRMLMEIWETGSEKRDLLFSTCQPDGLARSVSFAKSSILNKHTHTPTTSLLQNRHNVLGKEAALREDRGP